MDTNFFAVSAMSLLTVAAAVPAAMEIPCRRHACLYSSNYGRGRGLGRGLGVGVTLGAGVGVGLGVDVAVGVAVGLGVGVGLGATGTIAYA
jgi:hypothetical protein